MIRKIIIVLLTLAAVGTGALTAVSFRKDYISVLSDDEGDFEYQTYGWNPGGFQVGEKCMWFVRASLGEFKVSTHCYIPTSRAVRPMDIDGGVFYVRRASIRLRDETVLRAKKSGMDATSHRLFWKVEMQLWVPLVLFATYPTIAFIRGPLRRLRRRRKGLCVKCGYDLTGNESGVCSECGKGVEPTAEDRG